MMNYEIIAIGVSMGGLKVLKGLLSVLPENFLLPVVIVQHRGMQSDNTLCAHLQRYSALPVTEVEDKMEILSGHIYLAPADYHLLVERDHFALSLDAPIAFARPSVDVLFESAADCYREKIIGVILTGLNSDGAEGLAAIKKYGGLAIVQDPATAENSSMPEAAISAVEADYILPLGEIGPLLIDICYSHMDITHEN